MGSSAKKKKEKKKDFQKTKLKVGKANPKSANATDTSFKAKAIVLNQQLNIDAPTLDTQIPHHFSLLSSRTDSQKRDSLAYLVSILHNTSPHQPFPIVIRELLEKVLPLTLDARSDVRSGVFNLLQALPKQDIRDHVSQILPFLRAAMTHLSQDIRRTALDILSYVLISAGNDLVSSPGGWTKTLECCATLLNWKNLGPLDTWSVSKTSFRTDSKAISRTMQVTDQLLAVGLLATKDNETDYDSPEQFPLWDLDYHHFPRKANAYAYLDLFGKPIDDDSRILEDRDERFLIFNDRFGPSFMRGIDGAKHEGGDIGRVAGQLSKTLDAAATQD